MPAPLFKKGQSGNPRGRPPGVSVKTKVKLDKLFEVHGCNPADFLCKVMMNQVFDGEEKINCTIDLRVDAAKTLMNYAYHKLKATHITGDETKPLNMNLNIVNPEDKTNNYPDVPSEVLDEFDNYPNINNDIDEDD